MELVKDDKGSTLHFIWPIYLSLMDSYRTQLMNDSELQADIRQELLSQLQHHFTVHTMHKIAAFLNPLTKDTPWLDQGKRKALYDNVLDLMRQLKDSRSSDAKPSLEQEQPNGNNVETNIPMAKEQTHSGIGSLNLAKYFFGQNLKQNKSVDEELQEYMETPKPVAVNDLQYDVMKYWNSCTNCPTLRKLARDVFTIPGSSTSCTRFFDKFKRFSDTVGLDDDHGRKEFCKRLFVSYNYGMDRSKALT